MWPFVDPVTKRKVRFEEDITAGGAVDKGTLLKEVGGDLEVGAGQVCPASRT